MSINNFYNLEYLLSVRNKLNATIDVANEFNDNITIANGTISTSLDVDFTGNTTTIDDLYAGNLTVSGDLVVSSNVSSLVIDNLTVNQDTTITGNLTVLGTTTTLDSVNLAVEDPVITLNKNSVTPANDIGFLFQRYATANATNYNLAIAWDEVTDRLIIGKTPEDGVDNDISFNSEWFTISSNGNVGIGTATPGSSLEITGDATISGNVYSSYFVGDIVANNATITNAEVTTANVTTLTVQDGSISNGYITDLTAIDAIITQLSGTDAAFTANVSADYLTVNRTLTVSNNVVIVKDISANNQTLTGTLGVDGNVTLVRDLSANNATFNTLIVNNSVTMGGLTVASITSSGDLSIHSVTANGELIVTGNSTLTNIDGTTLTLTGGIEADTINVSSMSTNTFTVNDDFILTANLTANNVTVDGVLTLSSDLIAPGNITANNFIGDGSQLTGIPLPSLTSLGIPNHDQITVLANGNIGVGGNTSPFYSLVSDSNIQAAAFYGDGSNLTGLPTLISLGIDNHDLVTVDGTGNITANSFIGDGSQLTGINKVTEADAIALAIALG